MEPQKTPRRQSNLEKKRTKVKVSYFLTSDFATEKLQLPKQYCTGTKTDTKINGTEIN